MRSTLKTILIFALLSASVMSTANEIDIETINSDSVDIRGMLDKQISEIRQRQKEQQSKPVEKVEMAEAKVADVKIPAKTNVALNKEESGIKGFLKSLLLFVELSLLVLLGYFIKKRYDKINKLKVIELKRNVKDLREEKIGSFSNKELSLIRMKLNNTKIDLKDSGRSITQKAKSLAISKGEIHLAAKIKMMSQLN